MKTLARMDLDRLRMDSESFLGQAIELGVRFKKLPEHTADAMLGYLRVTATSTARRHRTGIAVAREDLERGVRQALISMELGLEDAAGGDLNVAVSLLSDGSFEAFRKRGWEIAFSRLETMRDASRSLLEQTGTLLLKAFLPDVRRWSRLVPGTWAVPPEEDNDGEGTVDPLKDYAAFREVRARLAFLRPLSEEMLQQLLGATDDAAGFEDLLRNLILSLALNLKTLLPGRTQVEAFRTHCFEEGKMLPEVREKILYLVGRQLEAEVEDRAQRQAIRREVEAEMELLEQVSSEPMGGFFITAEG